MRLSGDNAHYTDISHFIGRFIWRSSSLRAFDRSNTRNINQIYEYVIWIYLSSQIDCSLTEPLLTTILYISEASMRGPIKEISSNNSRILFDLGASAYSSATDIQQSECTIQEISCGPLQLSSFSFAVSYLLRSHFLDQFWLFPHCL